MRRWHAKVALQTAIGWMPYEHHSNYLMQRYVTKRLPRKDPQFDFNALATAAHGESWRRHGHGPLEDVTAYEFGSGYDLIGATMIWALGVERQVLLDIRPNLRPAIVRNTLAQFARRRHDLEAKLGRPLREPAVGDGEPLDAILARMGIEYLAPADGRAVPLPDASLDLIWSTYTLEHIPPDVLEGILREGARLLRPGGIISCRVDLKDHFAYIDPSVGYFDFLRYEPSRWRFLNPSLHYLNRLRWPEYLAIFRAAGLEVVDQDLVLGDERLRADLESMPLARRFARFSTDELLVRDAHVVLRRAG